MIQYLIVAIVDCLVGVIALSKKRTKATVALAMVAFSMALWSVELFLLTVIEDLNILRPLFHATRIGVFFIAPSLALLCWSILGAKSSNFKNFVIVPGFVLGCITALLNLTFFPTHLRSAENGYLPDVDIVYYLYAATFLYCLLASMCLGVFHFKTSAGRKKQRIKWLFISMGIALVSGALAIYLLPYNFYLSKLAGTATNVIIITSLLYPTIQHNLMDFRFALSVGMARLLILSMFAWSYFSFSSYVSQDWSSFGNVLLSLVFLVVILESYPAVLRWILPNTRKIAIGRVFDFDNFSLNLRQRLDACLSMLEFHSILRNFFSDNINVNAFSVFIKPDRASPEDEDCFIDSDNIVIDYMNGYIHADENDKNSNIIMADEAIGALKEEMVKSEFECCILVGGYEEPVALIFVGKKIDKKSFAYTDLSILEWLADELPQTISRIKSIDLFESELHEAKKQLSLIGIMNQYHHDIKAPLSVIDGVVTHELYDKEKQRKIILEQVALGSKLITMMATLLKGRRQRLVQLVSLDSIIEDCVLIFSHALEKSEIDVDQDMVVEGDADDLKILFINIIKNAVEATKNMSKVSIKVRAWKNESSVNVVFADNGVGMGKEQLDVLWSSGQSTKEKGSGVGMEAIKRIVEEHKANIDVSSQKGQGTDITLVFPLSA